MQSPTIIFFRGIFAVLIVFSLTSAQIVAPVLDRTLPVLPKFTIDRTRGSREANPLDKLSPELLALYEQFSNVQRGGDDLGKFTQSQLGDLFGIASFLPKPSITASVTFKDSIDTGVIKKANATVLAVSNKTAYLSIPIESVGELASVASVTEIGVLKAMHQPSPLGTSDDFEVFPIERGSSTATKLANEFNKQSLTGKGVVIGVIDSGIDWRHEDFRRADGTSRIVALWDLGDDSYQTSSGAIGSKPPVYLEASKKWLGTLYTNDQINAAIKGPGTVKSADRNGHGTAVAGTAASNGRATGNGVPVGTYAGVAPEADLIVVRAMDCDYFSPAASLTAEWIISTAKSLGKPAVVNMSYGSQFNTHDGNDEDETFIDSLVGPTVKGAAIAIAAGNDARYSLHAAGRFAPKKKGQADQFSSAIDFDVRSTSRLLAVFSSSDDWGLAFRSSSPVFTSADGKPAAIFIFNNGGTLDYATGSQLKNPDQFDSFFNGLRAQFADLSGKTDTLQLQMPTGKYVAWGYGATENVTDGDFDLYFVEPANANKANFGVGTQKSEMITSPGNAKNAITVGAFDFRSRWINLDGEATIYNLSLGSISPYSNPGFRRDGHVKPDITAPARYTISSLSESAKPAFGGCQFSMAAGAATNFTRDGYHIAWDGTSAATPFVTGLIALMLQKNANLDAEQIRQILKKTARSGGSIGAVPNSTWGWGMLNPEAALIATPLSPRGRRK